MGATITVKGVGISKFPPDTALIKATADNTDDWGNSAIAHTATIIANAKEKLEREQSILPRDIITTPIKITIEDHDNLNIIHHEEKASQSIIVNIMDLNRIAPIYSTLSAISGIHLNSPVVKRIKDKNKFEDEARKKAFLDAKRKAQTFASAAGCKKLELKDIIDDGYEEGTDEDESENMLFIRYSITAIFNAE
ncbi:MAG: SIMPL domain-containing protein [Spirochaetes bacterium]|uniref:SIMPL domain-containing protein n=1 Tax=Candidatus Ornithospirochaeta stercoripullorum TaxID=2840899 RepID=A0A9D9E1U4_9SPIO|nr:SIMPL domain-containing protein [Candidatus Ornithospirochaeta stercoripullorum]